MSVKSSKRLITKESTAILKSRPTAKGTNVEASPPVVKKKRRISSSSSSSPTIPRLRVVLSLEFTMIHPEPRPTDYPPPRVDSQYEVQKVHYYSDHHPNGMSIRHGELHFTYGAWITEWFVIRPKLKETLELLSRHADLYLFSGSSDQYNTAVAKVIDPSGTFFKKLLGHSNLVDINENGEIEPDGCLKEIKLIEKDFLEARTVLVDASTCDLKVRPQNSLKVTTFNKIQVEGFSNSPVESDEDLYKLAKLIVEKLVPAPDIRNLIQDYKIKET